MPPPTSSTMKHLYTSLSINSLYFSRREAHRKFVMFIKWSLNPYSPNYRQNIASLCYLSFSVEKYHIFHQIPNTLHGSKTVQTPWPNKFWALHPHLLTLIHFSENSLWLTKLTIAHTPPSAQPILQPSV